MLLSNTLNTGACWWIAILNALNFEWADQTYMYKELYVYINSKVQHTWYVWLLVSSSSCAYLPVKSTNNPGSIDQSVKTMLRKSCYARHFSQDIHNHLRNIRGGGGEKKTSLNVYDVNNHINILSQSIKLHLFAEGNFSEWSCKLPCLFSNDKLQRTEACSCPHERSPVN